MPDFYERIRRLADQVQDLLCSEGASVYEMREVFKKLQDRANSTKLPPHKPTKEGGEAE
jgi:hypothetical protein